MIRSVCSPLALAALAVSGCDRAPDSPKQAPAAPRSIEQQPAAPEVKQAPRSIMRPAVAAPEPPAPPPAPAIVTIAFGAPGPGLNDTQKAQLDALAARLSGTADTLILRGSTDSHGGDRRNRLVSRRRARLVAEYLEGKGITKGRITVIALGEDRPIAPNAKPDGSDDPEGRALNRRVEAEIIPAPPLAPAVAAPASATPDSANPMPNPGK